MSVYGQWSLPQAVKRCTRFARNEVMSCGHKHKKIKDLNQREHAKNTVFRSEYRTEYFFTIHYYLLPPKIFSDGFSEKWRVKSEKVKPSRTSSEKVFGCGRRTWTNASTQNIVVSHTAVSDTPCFCFFSHPLHAWLARPPLSLRDISPTLWGNLPPDAGVPETPCHSPFGLITLGAGK